MVQRNAQITSLAQMRRKALIKLPEVLEKVDCLEANKKRCMQPEDKSIQSLFSNTYSEDIIEFGIGKDKQKKEYFKIGVVLSGGQAAGGHNVICGIYDAMKKVCSHAQLIGFLDGPIGIIENRTKLLDQTVIDLYRNQGGFDMIGSGRTKIETDSQFEKALKTCQENDLDGLVIIGGDDSNTNAAFLAEYFKKNRCKTTVVGVPKTIDGDLKNEYIEISFGFDSACKTYSEIIGNILRDSLSAKKYYFFIKLMGRSASHIALECALQTHPNLTLISEEVFEKKQTLKEVVQEIANLVEERHFLGKNYGVVLIPEGIVEFIPEVKTLIKELNQLLSLQQQAVNSLSSNKEKIAYIKTHLSKDSSKCFETLPEEIQLQLLLDRDPHGNVQVSKIETERLFISLVKDELKKKGFKGKFNAQPHFCGYEGRSCFPSNFDATYCYSLGFTAVALINVKASGYMATVKNLAKDVDHWVPKGIPLTLMLCKEIRKGVEKVVIKKALVDLQGDLFQKFCQMRHSWKLEDDYRYPGPMQFFGDSLISNSLVFTLFL